jgi:hypothetical protein
MYTYPFSLEGSMASIHEENEDTFSQKDENYLFLCAKPYKKGSSHLA